MALAIENPQETRAADLVSLALVLGARAVPGWSEAEETLTSETPESFPLFDGDIRAEIERGADPLGDAYCRRFSAEERRPTGATYTPHTIVATMIGWAATHITPHRVIDPGAGSAANKFSPTSMPTPDKERRGRSRGGAHSAAAMSSPPPPSRPAVRRLFDVLVLKSLMLLLSQRVHCFMTG